MHFYYIEKIEKKQEKQSINRRCDVAANSKSKPGCDVADIFVSKEENILLY